MITDKIVSMELQRSASERGESSRSEFDAACADAFD